VIDRLETLAAGQPWTQADARQWWQSQAGRTLLPDTSGQQTTYVSTGETLRATRAAGDAYQPRQ
jgi:hypothetical protein